MQEEKTLQNLCINTIRFLSADGVQQANSGHPGLPMGTAPMAYAIWAHHLRHNPANPQWANRDRFILSGGHGSMLLYSLLHLTGYDLPLEELKRFRQWGSLTPGHPEYGVTPGVETTTGPLGQGFANGVGMAIAEAQLAQTFNRPGHSLFDHFIYAIVTDGDLMEGVAAEAASLAGHLQLGKLIYLYDDNRISIEGSTDIAFTEDRGKRFEAYGWHVQRVEDGLDVEAIDRAIEAAKQDPRPSLIMVRNIIGYGLPTRAGTPKAHGEPPGPVELDGAKENLGWPKEPRFTIPEAALALFRQAQVRGARLEAEWQQKLVAYEAEYPEPAAELKRRLAGALPAGWEAALPTFPADAKGMATRASSGKVLNALAGVLPELMGGSADLAPSTNTWMNTSGAFAADDHSGRNIHFGVREHGMGSVVNGMALYGGFVPFGATFLVFSDYMRPSIRVANIMGVQVIYVFTHDSIFVGEDGPTHEPVEHLAALRCIPGMVEMRPADGPETAAAWAYALRHKDGPTALILTRQSVPEIARDKPFDAQDLYRGAYKISETAGKAPDVVLVGTGSELQFAVAAKAALEGAGHAVRVVSMPSRALFMQQDAEYRQGLIPAGARKVLIEAGVAFGWGDIVGPDALFITQDTYGHSAPYKVLAEKLGYTNEQVTARILAWLES